MADASQNPDAASLERAGACFVYRFSAMASPCEVRIESDDEGDAQRLGRIAENEARRIERKYSLYRADSVLSRINNATGAEIETDAETARLIDYADQCFLLSDGSFDITSGVLRRVWTFDGSDRVPAKEDVDRVKRLVGWRKVSWRTMEYTP